MKGKAIHAQLELDLTGAIDEEPSINRVKTSLQEQNKYVYYAIYQDLVETDQ
jgi:hypothetical protein